MSAREAQAAKPRRRRTQRPKGEPSFLVIGRVLRPHGVRGELRLAMQTAFPAHLSEVDVVHIGDDHKPYPLKSFRLHKAMLLISVEGCDDRNEADTLRGEIVSIKATDAAPLKPGEYYHHQIVGLTVVTDTGEELGSVVEIIETGANDVYVVRGQVGEILLPAIKSVILKIEPSQMRVHLIDGLR
ncbi:MAG: 16S rRNA processing protein RimM [Chloroflexi bacterium]|nr:16S rRNA processing protein RimM [Chloroflexota bacterium]